MKRFNFISGRGSDLYKKPILSIDNSTSEGGTGHVGFICHKQPAMEKAIRDTITDSPYSQFRSKSLVNAIKEDEEGVTVSYLDAHERPQSIRGRFLVGADGKTGFVRKKYLEPKGVILEKCEG
jgi:2-polyprenyl-6-methoxyphenol hydroxylase-like FAD-dependent oxidoreductase